MRRFRRATRDPPGGVVGVRQLLALGLTRDEIAHRRRSGRWFRVHRGVYAVGHEALSDRGRMIAGLLAAGDGAVLSHRTAAYLWRLIPSMPTSVEVTLTNRRARQRSGIIVHRAACLDTGTQQGLPVTTPLQTIAQLPSEERERARAEALVLRLIPRSADDTAEPTRSELERRMLAALRVAGLPRPRINHLVRGHEVDLSWPGHGLIVETDGWAAHGHRRAFERDRARDAALTAAGYTVLRFTWRQVVEETPKVMVLIAQGLVRTPHHAPGDPPTRGVGHGLFPE